MSEPSWTPPPTDQVTTADGRVVTYCVYGPAAPPGGRADESSMWSRTFDRSLTRRGGGLPIGDGYALAEAVVGARRGARAPGHADWLVANLPRAQVHPPPGGHMFPPETWQDTYGWLRQAS